RTDASPKPLRFRGRLFLRPLAGDRWSSRPPKSLVPPGQPVALSGPAPPTTPQPTAGARHAGPLVAAPKFVREHSSSSDDWGRRDGAGAHDRRRASGADRVAAATRCI